ncbi:bifunctional hydroxymethylpyrimidine kinase/phosphomethylpyrimidine kinase [Akkermansiaceae bacterium]|nr:bifunctional hydroxymethylpyrimidine kinase/phosphomethylpyrimidine kinase [Akkermansiaceae bacterium]
MATTSDITRPVIPVMTIAGSDCSAGAGLQADLKTFQHFGLHGLTAVTCIVSETAETVRRVDAVDPGMMEDQILLMLDSFPLAVVKTGMLGSSEHVRRVAEIFRTRPDIRLVIDPVMVASTGASLLEPDAVESYRSELIPLACVITPNLPEAETLLGGSITCLEDMEAAARELSDRYGCAVLLKGGHLHAAVCTDLLFHGGRLQSFSSPRLSVRASHGTGCTLAAAVASGLALGRELTVAVRIAKDYLNDCLTGSYSFTSPGGGAIHALNQGLIRS